MLFENFTRDRSVTVSEFTRLIKLTIENEPLFSNVWVQGEVSNFTRAASGHLYFTMKDQGASLKCVMWKSSAFKNQGVAIKEGISLQVHGSLSLYEVSGQYQLVVDQVKVAGEGELYAEFARLKKQLEGEGLFDLSRKRPIPTSPLNIGVVTSETGAAFQDILNTLSRRLPLVTVWLAPTLVQGVDAPAGIIKALKLVNQVPNLDVIILARGGGSIEDLWSFNNEQVARAVADSKTPVITGVGHEIDFTLVDFASDMRAPTPTAAAEIATPISIDLLQGQIEAYGQLLQDFSDGLIRQLEDGLSVLRSRLSYFSPARALMTQSQVVDGLSQRLNRANENVFGIKRSQLDGLLKRLESNNPHGILKRGYAIVQDRATNQIIKTASQANPKSELDVTLYDGSLVVVVTEIKTEK